MGDGFHHVPIYKVFCHILEPEQMDCKEKVHLLGMDGTLKSKTPSEIFYLPQVLPCRQGLHHGWGRSSEPKSFGRSPTVTGISDIAAIFLLL